MSVLYHPRKANALEDALSRMIMGSVAYVFNEKKELVKKVHRFPRLGFWLEYFSKVLLIIITPNHINLLR